MVITERRHRLVNGHSEELCLETVTGTTDRIHVQIKTETNAVALEVDRAEFFDLVRRYENEPP